MTIKTQINGQDFEIEADDNVELVFSEGKITIRSKPHFQVIPTVPQIHIWPSPAPIHPYPWYGSHTITCDSGATAVGGYYGDNALLS